MVPSHLVLNEWSKAGPKDRDFLQKVKLSPEDRVLLAGVNERTLKLRELVTGLEVETSSFVGTVGLSGLRISILPKMGLFNLMGMIRYAHSLDPSILPNLVNYRAGEVGLADMLAQALLLEVERLARRGLNASYLHQEEMLTSPRGRISMKSAAKRTSLALECRFDDYTTDVVLNQALAEGLRLASRVVMNRELSFSLLRVRDRYFSEQSSTSLSKQSLEQLLGDLDRRSSHYRASLTFVQAIVEGCRLDQYQSVGESAQFSFLLDMNLLFERFLEQFFRRTRPAGYNMQTQCSRGEFFRYAVNPQRWNRPTVRPDLLFRRSDEVVAVGDAKYKNRTSSPPSSAELYQLTLYALSFCTGENRRVFLFHPLDKGTHDRPTELHFQAPGTPRVRIQLLGVPVDRILAEGDTAWPAWEWIVAD